jgi:hypothetical protein
MKKILIRIFTGVGIFLGCIMLGGWISSFFEEKEIQCEIKYFEYIRDKESFIEYRLKDKFVRSWKPSQCKTNNQLNTEYAIKRGPIILINPFRPTVKLPNLGKDIYLEE